MGSTQAWENHFPCLLLHPTPSRSGKKKLIVYDDKLGSALTVHTVPTRLAPSQAWPSARATITNTPMLAKRGWGQLAHRARRERGRAGCSALLSRRQQECARARDSNDIQGKPGHHDPTQAPGSLLHDLPPLKKKKQSPGFWSPSPWASSAKWVCTAALREHSCCQLPARSLQHRQQEHLHLLYTSHSSAIQQGEQEPEDGRPD